mmetsp:Transcript_5289/g.10185  ORF Transcript_5289/g.10185 Transcript_5289/m.10185 type:complete len:84 (+) Transcript_5289:220-471(+)
MERLDLIWITRSASLVSEIIPDLSAHWDRLVETWGEEYARQARRVSICCTSMDATVRELSGIRIGFQFLSDPCPLWPSCILWT